MIFNHIVKLRLFGAVLLMVSVIFAASAACLAQQIYTDGSTVYQNGMPIGMICGYCGGRGSVTCNICHGGGLCRSCNGAGQKRNYANAIDDNLPYMRNCGVCQGTGYCGNCKGQPERRCPSCFGAGYSRFR